ncbi:MAG: hypothetical protein OIF32_12335 [Campylobacterales bacterium]|nr:hypothetical protein [Campylobacterales bacterium]
MTGKIGNPLPSSTESITVSLNNINSKDEETISKQLSFFNISRDIWDIFMETKKSFAKEKNMDFSTSALSLSTLHILPIQNLKYTGPAYEPIYPTKSMERAAELKRVVETQKNEPTGDYFEWYSHLKERIEDLSSRDESWVRRTYSLGSSDIDNAFAKEKVSQYKILTELAIKFATELKKHEDKLADKSLLNVVV